MTFKEYHQNSQKEQALAKNICNCEIICIHGGINFLDELIAAAAEGEHDFKGACITVFL
jgi:hypothetical protein